MSTPNPFGVDTLAESSAAAAPAVDATADVAPSTAAAVPAANDSPFAGVDLGPAPAAPNVADDPFAGVNLPEAHALEDLTQTMGQAVETNPADESALEDLSRQIGKDIEFTRRNRKWAEGEVARGQIPFDAILSDTPVVASHLADIQFAKQAHTSVPALTDIERVMGLSLSDSNYWSQNGKLVQTPEAGQPEMSMVDAMANIASNPTRMFQGVGAAAWARYQQFYNDQLHSQMQAYVDVNTLGGNYVLAGVPGLGGDVGMLGYIMERYAPKAHANLLRVQNQVATANEQLNIPALLKESNELEEQIRSTTPAGMNWLEHGMRSGLISTVTQVPALMLGAVTRNPNTALAIMGSLEFGNARLEAIKEGMNPAGAFVYALINTGIEVGTEKLPTDALMKGLGDGWKGNIKNFILSEIGGEQLASFGQALTGAVAEVGDQGKAIRDAYEKGDTANLWEIAKTTARDTLVSSVTSSATQIAGVQAVGVTTRRIDRALRDHQKLQMMADLANRAELRVNNPKRFAALVKEMGFEAGTEYVYLDPTQAEVYLQQLALPLEDPLTEAVEELKEQVAEAAATGSLVGIPIETFMSQYAGTEVHEALKQDMKTDPEGMTLNEVFNEDVQARIAELQAKATDELEGGSQVYDNVYDQLIKASTPADVASSYALVHQAFFETLLERPGLKAAGVTMQDLMDKYGLTIMEEIDPRLAKHMEQVDLFDMQLDKMREGSIPTEGEARGATLGETLAAAGIDTSDMNIDVANGADLSGLADTAQSMFDQGFLEANDPQTLVNAVLGELVGKPTYSPLNANEDATAVFERAQALQEVLDDNMLDLSQLDNEAVRKALGQADDQRLEQDEIAAGAVTTPVADVQDFGETRIGETVQVRETGEQVDIVRDAQRTFEQVGKRRGVVEQLADCMGA